MNTINREAAAECSCDGGLMHNGGMPRPCPYCQRQFYTPRTPVSALELGIEPTEADIGRQVLYVPHHARDEGFAHPDVEYGVISSFNHHCVFARYGSQPNAKATDRSDLSWGAFK